MHLGLAFIFHVVVLSASTSELDYDIPPTCDGAIQHGYNCERHEVVTEDGFILGVYRLTKPELRNCSLSPVLLQHGAMGCFTGWLMTGPSNGLAYIMADEGYDVWLGNSRGSIYSRSHLNLSSDDPAFWKWSWHEMGLYDLPATIDYMLMVTGYEQILYVGFSMGNTVFFVMCTSRPEYNSKVEHMIALGPTIFVGNVTTPLKSLAPYVSSAKIFLDQQFGEGQFLTNLTQFQDLARSKICFAGRCVAVIKLLMDNLNGADDEQWNEEIFLRFGLYYGTGTSTNTVLHYTQEVKSGMFEQFDHGIFKNLMLYKSIRPPSYDLSLVSTPMTLFVGDNDLLANSENVATLLNHLNNDVDVYRSPHPTFCHTDFIWAKDVNELVNNVVLSLFASKTKASVSEKCIGT